MLATSFLKAVRLVMLVTCPLYLGLSVVAPETVAVVLGHKWSAMAPLMTILAFSMPAQTLHIMFAPAVNALGHPKITMRASMLGALVMPPAFLFGLQWGATGLAYAWLLVFPLLPAFTFIQARGKLGIGAHELAAAVAPGLLASVAMALAVFVFGHALGPLTSWQRLALEIPFGAICYAGLLLLIARPALFEILRLLSRRRPRPNVLPST